MKNSDGKWVTRLLCEETGEIEIHPESNCLDICFFHGLIEFQAWGVTNFGQKMANK